MKALIVEWTLSEIFCVTMGSRSVHGLLRDHAPLS